MTRIAWTETTWNVVTGCSKVSPGCANCYAESTARRFPERFTNDGTWRPWTPENVEHNVLLHPERLRQPSSWRRPRLVFVCSMSDLFHEVVPDDFIAQVFAMMAGSSRHTFQVLTKRPERMRALLGDWSWWERVGAHMLGVSAEDVDATRNGLALPVLPNVWCGTSIENRRFVGRADELRATPAAVRFVSAEPLLGPLLPDGPTKLTEMPFTGGGRSTLMSARPTWTDGYEGDGLNLAGIDWLIAGGESGPGARPCDEQWLRDLRDACEIASTAYFLKQLGGRSDKRADEKAVLDGRTHTDMPQRTRVEQERR